ncbi:MAG: IPT/TIG domain-containing protein [Nitrospinota bacterium]
MPYALKATLNVRFFSLLVICAACSCSFLVSAHGEIAKPPPVISSVVPSRGLANSETLITIWGKGIQQGASVQIGGKSVIPMSYFPPKSLTVYSPPGLPGSVDIILTNPDEQVTVLKEGFQYVRDLSAYTERDRPTVAIKKILSKKLTAKEKIKIFLVRNQVFLMKAGVYGAFFLLLLVAFSLNRKKRLIKKIRREQKSG